MTWSRNCVLSEMTAIDAEGDNPAIVAPTGLEFQITDTKLYVPVVTLSHYYVPKNSFSHYYVSNDEIKDFNVLIDK